ncbi:MAG: hypothetical protein M1828_000769 [Chrysothrix sp. TS-e1954]|nr:MAG: hypothetical protein M1828_000769 [Chrysothrix sp. TS-e1954]
MNDQDSPNPSAMSTEEKQRLLEVSQANPLVTIRTVKGVWYKDEEPVMEDAFRGLPSLLLKAYSSTAREAILIGPVWNVREDIARDAVRTLCEWMLKTCQDADSGLDVKGMSIMSFLRLWLAARNLGVDDAVDELDEQVDEVMTSVGVQDAIRSFHFLGRRGLQREDSDVPLAIRKRIQLLANGEALDRHLNIREVEVLFHAPNLPFPSSKQRAIILAANEIWENDYRSRQEFISGLRKPLRKRFQGVWNQLDKNREDDSTGTVMRSRRKPQAQKDADHVETLKTLLQRC